MRGRYPSSILYSPVKAGTDFRFYAPEEDLPRGVRVYKRFEMPLRDSNPS